MTRIHYHVFLFLLFFTKPFTSLTQTQTISLTLDKAIEMALSQNTEVIISTLHTDQAEFLLKESRGNYLPKINAYGDYARNIDRAVIFFPNNEGSVTATELGSDNTFSGRLSLIFPIFLKFNNSIKNYAYANQNLKREIDRGTKLNITANVKKAYYSHQVMLASKSVMEKGLKNALENLQNTQDKLEEGVVTEFDETSAKVEVAAARSNLMKAKSNIIPSANRLKLLLGLGIKDVLELTDDLLQEEFPLSQIALEKVSNKNSDIRQKELQVELANKQMAMAKADYFPRISVLGNYQYQTQADDFDINQYDWVKTSNLGLQIQIPLFNGTVTKHKVQQASIDREIIDQQKQHALASNQMAHAEIMNQLDFAKQRVRVQEDNKVLAQSALELIKERYNAGDATFLEVNNSELSLIQAQLNWLQAILDYKMAWYDYELLMGRE